MDEPAVTVTTHVGRTPSVASRELRSAGGAGDELLRAGDRVGRYVIDAHVGAGGMGRIYTAHDPKLDRRVALKLLRAEQRDEQGRDRLLREARALAKLAHPHVVAVHDTGVVGDQVFVAMEYVSGTTLREVVAQRRHGWREALDLLLPVAHGLAAVHAAGLVHRDLKPANVMLGDDGRVRLMDFGLARAPAAAAAADGETGAAPPVEPEGATLTRTGTVLGTPPYMAPEQWHGRVADARCDQFAFCVTLWEALHGERPFAGQGVTALERAITQGVITAPARLGEVPRWLHRVLERGLSVEPGDRFPSMDALIERLEHGRRRARDRWIAAGIGLVAMATVGLAFGAVVEREGPGVAPLPEARTPCEADEVCAQGPMRVPVCTGVDGEAVSEGRPCSPNADDPCPERESCVPISSAGGEPGKCMPVCEVRDDRPECAPGCYNQQCAGNFDLCAREHGVCRPVPCTADDECTSVASCDFPSRGGLGFQCNVDAGFCERRRTPEPGTGPPADPAARAVRAP